MINQNISHVAWLFGTTDLLLWQVLKRTNYLTTFLGAFAKLRKKKTDLRHVRPTVRTH
jgi:hypothetical protein